jgi:hypothetical protein
MPPGPDWPSIEPHGPHTDHQTSIGVLPEGEPWKIDTAEPPSEAARVVVLVIDGARIDETFGDGFSSVTSEPTAAFFPEIRANLLSQGSLVRSAYNSGVTITAEGHASILTGARVPLANLPSDDGAGAFRPEIPTLLELLRAQSDAEQSHVSVGGNTMHLQGLTHSLHPAWGAVVGADYAFVEDVEEAGQPVGDDVSVIESVQNRLTTLNTRLLVANLHQMDRAGHYNVQPTAYAERVKEVDQPLVAFWEWIQADPRYKDHTTLIIVADHGRHRRNSPEDHRHHGDSCAGCRQIPMFLLGPRIRKDFVSYAPATLEDIGATIGAILGLNHPHVEGRVLTELMVDPAPTDGAPQGSSQIAATSTVRAVRTYLSAAERRSVVAIDDTIMSTPDAMYAEGPTTTGDASIDVVCWRELKLDFAASDDSLAEWPWNPECRVKTTGSIWTDMNVPIETVSPYFSSALGLSSEGDVLLAFADNPTGNWESLEQSVRLHRWNGTTGWQAGGPGATKVRFPLHVSLLPQTGGALVAYVTSDAFSAEDTPAGISPGSVHGRARYRRHIQVAQVRWTDGETDEWTQVFRGYTNDHFADGAVLPAPPGTWSGWAEIGRGERPALHRNNDKALLAFIAHPMNNSGPQLWMSHSVDQGQSWPNPIVVDDSGLVIPAITPRWFGPSLYWARATGSGVAICRMNIGGAPDCQVVDGDAIDSIAPHAEGVSIGVRVDGEWQIREALW